MGTVTVSCTEANPTKVSNKIRVRITWSISWNPLTAIVTAPDFYVKMKLWMTKSGHSWTIKDKIYPNDYKTSYTENWLEYSGALAGSFEYKFQSISYNSPQVTRLEKKLLLEC